MTLHKISNKIKICGKEIENEMQFWCRKTDYKIVNERKIVNTTLLEPAKRLRITANTIDQIFYRFFYEAISYSLCLVGPTTTIK